MVGGAGYMAGRAGQRAGYREQDEQDRIAALEAQQAQPQAPPPAPAAAPATGGTDMVSRIKELASLKDSGVLTQDEFNAAKAKLLSS
jgi:membrane protease subunit (stomatin/prohibitin family)